MCVCTILCWFYFFKIWRIVNLMATKSYITRNMHPHIVLVGRLQRDPWKCQSAKLLCVLSGAVSSCQMYAIGMAFGPDMLGGPAMLPHTSECQAQFIMSCSQPTALSSSNFQVTPIHDAFSSQPTISGPTLLNNSHLHHMMVRI